MVDLSDSVVKKHKCPYQPGEIRSSVCEVLRDSGKHPKCGGCKNMEQANIVPR